MSCLNMDAFKSDSASKFKTGQRHGNDAGPRKFGVSFVYEQLRAKPNIHVSKLIFSLFDETSWA